MKKQIISFFFPLYVFTFVFTVVFYESIVRGIKSVDCKIDGWIEGYLNSKK